MTVARPPFGFSNSTVFSEAKMKHPSSRKRSRWFWAGVVLLSISALFLLLLVIIAEPGEVKDTMLGGLLFAFIPIAVGIACLVSEIVIPKGKKPAAPEVV